MLYTALAPSTAEARRSWALATGTAHDAARSWVFFGILDPWIIHGRLEGGFVCERAIPVLLLLKGPLWAIRPRLLQNTLNAGVATAIGTHSSAF